MILGRRINRVTTFLCIIAVGYLSLFVLPLQAEDVKFPIVADDQAKLAQRFSQILSADIFLGESMLDAYSVVEYAKEASDPSIKQKVEPLLLAWFEKKKNSYQSLKKCLSDECLPVDALNFVKETTFVLFLLNNWDSIASSPQAKELSVSIKDILAAVISNVHAFKLSILTKIRILEQLSLWGEQVEDKDLTKIVDGEVAKILPVIARSERVRGFRDQAVARDILNAQIIALGFYMQLYHSTADKAWQMRAVQVGNNLLTAFSIELEKPLEWQPTMIAPLSGTPAQLALLYHYSGKAEYYQASHRIIDSVLPHQADLSSGQLASILRGIQRLNKPPLHITIVGRKMDYDAVRLYSASRRIKSSYKRLEWWDQTEGKMLNPDVKFPSLKKAAAFVCTNRRCSMPLFEPEEIEPMIQEMAPQ